MNPQLISPIIAGAFGMFSAAFLALWATRGTSPAKKTWLRIGIIFSVVAVTVLLLRPK